MSSYGAVRHPPPGPHRRLGDRLGTVGVIVDEAILVGYVRLGFVNVLSS
jgi:hypothetical protein